MKKFVFAYHGAPRFETPDAGKAHMEAWRTWMAGLGGAVIDPGLPLGDARTVSADGIENGGGANPLTGITIVTAPDLDTAVAMTKGCPHLNGGTIEVAEAVDMEM